MREFKDHFSALARDYASYRPRYPATLFADLARAAPGRERAWDCATGSGQAAGGLAAHFREVVATDASAAQIAEADPENELDALFHGGFGCRVEYAGNPDNVD